MLSVNRYWIPRVQRLTGFANNTLMRWSKLLQGFNLILKDSRGKIYLNENSSNRIEKHLVDPKYGNVEMHNKSSTDRKKKIDTFKQRRNNGYCLIATVAALGNSSWSRTSDHKYGLVSMTDIQTGSDISFISSPLPGIGISDFRKHDKELVQSMLDTRTFVDFNERFSHLNLSDREAQSYMNELCNHDPPILKEITVFDYGFLYFVVDSTQPDSIRLERESPFTYARNTIRLSADIDNNDSAIDKLPVIYEIISDIYQDKINLRILIDTNSEKAKKFLGLDTVFSKGNNFSISIWREKRYLVADSLLREFIKVCNFMFEAINEILEKLYCLSLLSSDVRREYIKWYQGAYGYFRRGAEMLTLDRIAINRIKQNIKKIKTFAKQGKNEERKKVIKELDYACRYRMWGPYQKTSIINSDFTYKDLVNIEKRLKQIDGNSYNMFRQLNKRIEKYHSELMCRKFENVRKRCSIITEPLLDISYPAFLNKLLK